MKQQDLEKMKLDYSHRDDMLRLSIKVATEQSVCDKAVRIMAVRVINNVIRADSSVLKRVDIEETFF